MTRGYRQRRVLSIRSSKLLCQCRGAFHTPAARLLQDDAEAAAAASAVTGCRKYVKGEDRKMGFSRPRERVRR